MAVDGNPAGAATDARVRRGFVDIAEGQVHYRVAGQCQEGKAPLVMLHASPGSSRLLEPLMRALAPGRRVIATDTLGNGDSSPPASSSATIAYFAEAHLRALDALGLARFDLYGTHTGACIACEIAIARPGCVRSLVLDGVSLYSPEEQADMLAHYAPAVELDQHGGHFLWAWNFVRDAYLFWPWYKRDAAHQRRLGLPRVDELHGKALEVLKSIRTYHIPYRAAIRYDKTARLPLVKVPTLLTCADTDMLMAYFEAVKTLMPEAASITTPGIGTPEAVAATAQHFERFLNRPGAN